MADLSPVLTDAGRRVLRMLADHEAHESFYLAGGTGLALQLGHRTSMDFDLFSLTNPLGVPERAALLERLRGLDPNLVVARDEAGTLEVRSHGVSVAFYRYHYPLLADTVTIFGLAVASLEDIAAMKLAAIVGRGSRRDFVDLYSLMQELPLEHWLNGAATKYADVHDFVAAALRAVVYFDDAEGEPMPLMLRQIEWSAVKAELSHEATRLGRSYFGLP